MPLGRAPGMASNLADPTSGGLGLAQGYPGSPLRVAREPAPEGSLGGPERRKGSGGQSDEIQETSGWWSLQEHVTASTTTGKVGTPRRRQVSRTERIRSTQRSPVSWEG